MSPSARLTSIYKYICKYISDHIGSLLFLERFPGHHADEAATMRRFSGDHAGIAGIMQKYATVPDFIQYGENGGYKLNRGRILALREMWRELRSHHESLSWSQRDGEQIFKCVAEKARDIWPRRLTSEEESDYAHRMSKRFRLMCRHIKQSYAKHANTAWLKQLWGNHQQDIWAHHKCL